MTKRVTIYGYAYTPKTYEGGTGRYALEMDVDVPDDVDVEEYVSRIEAEFMEEGIKIYNGQDENKGTLSYGISETTEPPAQDYSVDTIFSELMDTATKMNKPRKKKQGTVERNTTEHNEEGEEYGGV